MKEYEKKQTKKEKPLDVILSIKDISRDGVVSIAFNQKLLIPEFVRQA